MKEYHQDHLLAKILLAIILTVLALIEGFSVLSIVMVWLWLFGTNPLAYVIEKVRNHPHKHDKV